MNAHIYAHGANLFNDVAVNKVTAGKYIDSAGVEQNNNLPGTSTLNHTSYMPVTGGTEYTYKWHGPTISTSGMIVAIIWYTSNKDFIERTTKTLQAVTDFTLQGSSPPNAAYAIVNFPSETWPNSDVSLEFYETAVEWRDYTPNMYTHGPNLFDDVAANKAVPGMLFLSGEYKTGNPDGCAIYIPVIGGQAYTFTIDVPGSAMPNPGLQSVFSVNEPANGVSYKIDYETTWVNHGYTNKFTRTAPAKANYMAIQLGSEDNANKSIRIYNTNAALGWNNGTSYKYTSGSWD